MAVSESTIRNPAPLRSGDYSSQFAIRIGILTVSDRSAAGERPDLSGPALAQAVTERLAGAEVVIAEVVPDERAAISRVVGARRG